MNRIYRSLFAVVLMFAVGPSLVRAQTAPSTVPATKASAAEGLSLDDESLRRMLEGLGYDPKKLGVNNYVVYRIQLESKCGASETFVAIDPQNHTIVIGSGGQAVPQESTVESIAVYRKILIANNRLGNSKIFINENQLLGLLTQIGNRHLSPAVLKRTIETHSRAMEETLAPLAQELVASAKSADEAGGQVVQSGKSSR